MKELNKIKIAHLPLIDFLIIAVVVLVATYTGTLGENSIGALALLFVLGGIFFYVGGILPIIGKWLGGAVLLPLFGGSALVYFHLLPKYTIKSISTFMSSGFIDIYIVAVIVGSILVMDKKLLLKAAWRVLPVIIGTQLFIVLFLWLGGLLLHWSPLKSIFMTGLPTYAGGSSGAIVAVPSIYQSFFHHDVGSYAAKFLVFLNINNVLCVFLCSVMNQLGMKKPNWTDNGQLLKSSSGNQDMVSTNDLSQVKVTREDMPIRMSVGFLVCLAFIICGQILGKYIPRISVIAWTAILVILFKASPFARNDLCVDAGLFENFMLKGLLAALITGIGISSLNLAQVAEYFSPANLFVLVMGLIGAVVGSLIFGLIFHFNPIESIVSIGLQVGNTGGSGAVATLTAANRMELMPFATIANRIGGAIMLIWISLLLPLFL